MIKASSYSRTFLQIKEIGTMLLFLLKIMLLCSGQMRLIVYVNRIRSVGHFLCLSIAKLTNSFKLKQLEMSTIIPHVFTLRTFHFYHTLKHSQKGCIVDSLEALQTREIIVVTPQVALIVLSQKPWLSKSHSTNLERKWQKLVHNFLHQTLRPIDYGLN